MKDLAAPPVSPVVWEAALGRRVVLIEDRLWVNAREKARAMLGGEPEYVEADRRMIYPKFPLLSWDWGPYTDPRLFPQYLRGL